MGVFEVFCITTFHTGEPYLSAANMLADSCSKQGVHCIIKEVEALPPDKPDAIKLGKRPDRPEWAHTFPNELWHTKGRIALEAMEETGLPVWWVDADAILVDGDKLKKDTKYMVENNVDFACHMFKKPGVVRLGPSFNPMQDKSNLATDFHRHYGTQLHWPAGGAYFFNNTPGTRDLIEHWDEMHKMFPDEDDQLTIERAMKATTYLSIFTLPIGYHQQYDDTRGRGKTPVFKQMQIRRNAGYLDKE